MKRVFRAVAIVVVVGAAIGADCCDVMRHDTMTESQKSVAVCKERGGVPVLETDTRLTCDDGGHCFQILKRCDFPGQIRLQGEK